MEKSMVAYRCVPKNGVGVAYRQTPHIDDRVDGSDFPGPGKT